jgi:hypothetical protein
LRDPLLTLLTVVLVVWMFVLAPLHESAARDTNIVGFLLALAVAGALLVLSGRAVSVLLMLSGSHSPPPRRGSDCTSPRRSTSS